MKRILIYNQVAAADQETTRPADFEVEQVGSISEVLKRHLLNQRQVAGAAGFDMFVVNIEEPTTQIVEFIKYVSKNKPELPLIVLARSEEKLTVLKNLAKGLVCNSLDLNLLSGFLR